MKPRVERFEVTDPEWLALLSPEIDEWLNSWTVEEHKRYGDHHAAVNAAKTVVAAERTASELERALRRLGNPKVRVFYLPPPDVAIIYSLHA